MLLGISNGCLSSSSPPVSRGTSRSTTGSGAVRCEKRVEYVFNIRINECPFLSPNLCQGTGGKVYRHGARTPSGSLSRESSFGGGGGAGVVSGDVAVAAAAFLSAQSQQQGRGVASSAGGSMGGAAAPLRDGRAFGDESFDIGSEATGGGGTTMSFDVDEDLPGLGGGGGAMVGGSSAKPSSYSNRQPAAASAATALGVVLDEDLEDIEDSLTIGPMATFGQATAGSSRAPAPPPLKRVSSGGGGGGALASPSPRQSGGGGGRPPLPRTPSGGSSTIRSSIERAGSIPPPAQQQRRSSGGGGAAGGVSMSSGFGDSLDSLPGMHGGAGAGRRQVPLHDDSGDEDESGYGQYGQHGAGAAAGGAGPGGAFTKVGGQMRGEPEQSSTCSACALQVPHLACPTNVSAVWPRCMAAWMRTPAPSVLRSTLGTG